jgi:hypothetical protein
MNRRWRSPALAASVFAFVVCIWLNQSVGGADWEAVRDRVFADPGAHVLEAARYPFVFLYRRSHDEEIYYATASALLGKPFPPSFLERGGVPAAFARLADTLSAGGGRLRVPYSEVPLEYPPLVLPFIVAPRLVGLSFEPYAFVFCMLMGGCLVGACAIAVRTAEAGPGVPGVEDARSGTRCSSAGRWWLACALVLAHGAIAVQRLDAIVALLLALALRAAVNRRPASLGAWVGLAAATKVIPGLLLPVFLSSDWSFYRRPRAAATALGGAALGFALGLLPLALSGHLGEFLSYHGLRGLHVESTGGALYGAARALLGRPAVAALDFGSFNFHGPVPDAIAAVSPFATLAAIVVLSANLATGRAPQPKKAAAGAAHVFSRRAPGQTASAALAGMAALWLLGKVFSPQYLTWAIPLVLVCADRAPLRPWIVGAFALALILGQVYWRGYYDLVYGQHPVGLGTLIARQAAIVLFFAWTLRDAKRADSSAAIAKVPSPAAAAPIPSESVRGR